MAPGARPCAPPFGCPSVSRVTSCAGQKPRRMPMQKPMQKLKPRPSSGPKPKPKPKLLPMPKKWFWWTVEAQRTQSDTPCSHRASAAINSPNAWRNPHPCPAPIPT
ncbi:hypothetical protein [Lysobacter gummosus]|uniref:hypothetical protein n=1 Tax=Lysobacter gummosus TaxID=262324 RepID=UPI003633FEB7